MSVLRIVKQRIKRYNSLVCVYKFFKWFGIKYFYNLTLNLKFKDECGYKLNLKDPKGFSEKIQWIKVNCRNPLMTDCADKYKVRDYVSKKIGGAYLTKIYGVYKSSKEIDYDELPDSFVLKSNHSSGQIVIVKDKNNINIMDINKIIDGWLSENYFYVTGEWVYKNIEPVIICEELLEEEIIDYKFYCFNGTPKFLYVSQERTCIGKESLRISDRSDIRVSFLDLNWEKTEFQRNDHPQFEELPDKPDCLIEMIEIAKNLSRDFYFCRVDLYYLERKGIIFSELTFYPNGGFAPFYPTKYERVIGDWLELPIKRS